LPTTAPGRSARLEPFAQTDDIIQLRTEAFIRNQMKQNDLI
jgi:hypothetical protein